MNEEQLQQLIDQGLLDPDTLELMPQAYNHPELVQQLRGSQEQVSAPQSIPTLAPKQVTSTSPSADRLYKLFERAAKEEKQITSPRTIKPAHIRTRDHEVQKKQDKIYKDLLEVDKKNGTKYAQEFKASSYTKSGVWDGVAGTATKHAMELIANPKTPTNTVSKEKKQYTGDKMIDPKNWREDYDIITGQYADKATDMQSRAYNAAYDDVHRGVGDPSLGESRKYLAAYYKARQDVENSMKMEDTPEAPFYRDIMDHQPVYNPNYKQTSIPNGTRMTKEEADAFRAEKHQKYLESAKEHRRPGYAMGGQVRGYVNGGDPRFVNPKDLAEKMYMAQTFGNTYNDVTKAPIAPMSAYNMGVGEQFLGSSVKKAVTDAYPITGQARDYMLGRRDEMVRSNPERFSIDDPNGPNQPDGPYHLKPQGITPMRMPTGPIPTPRYYEETGSTRKPEPAPFDYEKAYLNSGIANIALNGLVMAGQKKYKPFLNYEAPKMLTQNLDSLLKPAAEQYRASMLNTRNYSPNMSNAVANNLYASRVGQESNIRNQFDQNRQSFANNYNQQYNQYRGMVNNELMRTEDNNDRTNEARRQMLLNMGQSTQNTFRYMNDTNNQKAYNQTALSTLGKNYSPEIMKNFMAQLEQTLKDYGIKR